MTDKLDSLLTYFQRSAGAGNKLKNSRSFCLEFPAAHRASRIAAQKHFASDVFVSGTMGW
jgi:hypothetical protein